MFIGHESIVGGAHVELLSVFGQGAACGGAEASYTVHPLTEETRIFYEKTVTQR